MDIDAEVQRARNWLQALPDGATVIWYSDHVTADEPYTCHWVDVNIPAMESAMRWNWSLTIQEPDDPDPVGPFVVAAPYDTLGMRQHGNEDTESLMPCWSIEAIETALRQWAVDLAERPDLVWVWDRDSGPSPLLARANDALARVTAGTETLVSWDEVKHEFDDLA